MNNVQVKRIIERFGEESKKCKALDEYLEIAYSFRFEDFFINPIQIRGEIKELLQFLEKVKPKRVLEIGTATGGTLYLLCNVVSNNATILSIDLPGGSFGGEFFPDWKLPIYKSFARDDQNIHILRSNSHDNKTLEQIRKILGENKIDFLLIDGDHSYEGVKKDFEMYAPLVSNEGIIAFHDIKSGPASEVGGVPQFWNEIRSGYPHAEIIDDFLSPSYGIGILFLSSIKEIVSQNRIVLQTIMEINKRQIARLQKRVFQTESNVKNNPFGFLLYLYSQRDDLRRSFPEVSMGNYTNLIQWAVSVCERKFEENEVVISSLSNFVSWYKEYTVREKSLDQIAKISESIAILTQKIEEQRTSTQELTKLFLAEQEEVRKLNGLLGDEQTKSVKLGNEVNRLNSVLGEEQTKSVKLGNEVNRLNGLLCDEQEKSVNLKGQIRELTRLYENELHETKVQLENIVQSQGWQFIIKFRNSYNRYFPPSSKLRKYVDDMVLLFIQKNKNKSLQATLTNEQKITSTIPQTTNIVESSNNYAKWKNDTIRILSSKPRKDIDKHGEVTVIVAVHDNSKVVIPCIESVLKWTSKPYSLFIIDDGSKEKELLSYLDKISKFSFIKIMHNETNIGYVKSINKAIKNTETDIILLNSDTIVTKNWLDKIYSCAYSNNRISTVSPLSNNATICSIPEFLKQNDLPEGLTVDEFSDIVERTSERRYPTIPTCVGFCMYIKRSIINKIGLFDEVFSPAYEEENDFCMRAYKSGFVSALDDSTFIFHHGKASYKTQTNKLQEEHMQLMLQKHPEYLEIVSGFCNENPLQYIHKKMSSLILQNKKDKFKNVLMILHRPVYSKNPGGTEELCKMLYEGITGKFSKYLMYTEDNTLVVEENAPSGRRILYRFIRNNMIPGFVQCTKDEEEFFSNILDELNIGLIHFQHMLFMPLNFFHVAKNKGIKTILSINDFYYLCPRIYLFENGEYNGFCNACTDLARCDRCLKQIGYNEGFQADWRNECQKMLQRADMIIIPTKSTLDLYEKVFKINWDHSKIIEHGISTSNLISKFSNPTLSSNIFRIGFVGAIRAERKGKDIVLDMLTLNKNEKIEWHFFGRESNLTEFIKERKIKPVGKIINHGGWSKSENIPSILREAGIHIVILPSQENYSLVLSEVWSARIPVIVPDLVALGERVRKEGAGWIYPFPSPAQEILKIIDAIYNNPNEYAQKVSKFQNLIVRSAADCIKEYESIYQNLFSSYDQSTIQK